MSNFGFFFIFFMSNLYQSLCRCLWQADPKILSSLLVCLFKQLWFIHHFHMRGDSNLHTHSVQLFFLEISQRRFHQTGLFVTMISAFNSKIV